MKKFPLKTALLALTLISIPALSSAADEFEEGFLAAELGNYDKAMKKLGPLAESGHMDAQFNIALLYHNGSITGQVDEKQALRWYEMAAKNGHYIAQEYLAVAYREGWFGLKPNSKKAKYWEKKLKP